MHIVPSLAAIPVIQRLRSVFAQFGIPQTIVTDNGATFCSAEFQQFLESNGIEHLKSAPYHPSSNGLAERAVQTFKQGLRKLTEGSLFDRLSRFLFAYSNTPHSTTGASPAQLMFGRPMRSRLDLLRPNIAARVVKKQEYQKQYHENEKIPIQFESGHKVYIKNFSGSGPRWLPGTVSRRVGKVFYEVSTEEGGTMKRHKNQLRPRTELTAVLQDTGLATSPGREDEGEHEVLEDGDKEAIEEEVERDLEGENEATEDRNELPEPAETEQTSDEVKHRYPRRNRRPPDYY